MFYRTRDEDESISEIKKHYANKDSPNPSKISSSKKLSKVIILFLTTLDKQVTMSRDNKKSNVLLPVLVTAFAIPLSMLFWIINVIYSILSSREHQTEGKSSILSLVKIKKII